MLARIHEPKAWEQFVSDAVFHYAAAILAVVARGALSRWYPHPFIDAATHGYGQVLVNAVLVLAVLAAVAGLYGAGDGRLRRVGAPR